jgi:hypothetical protein
MLPRFSLEDPIGSLLAASADILAAWGEEAWAGVVGAAVEGEEAGNRWRATLIT